MMVSKQEQLLGTFLDRNRRFDPRAMFLSKDIPQLLKLEFS